MLIKFRLDEFCASEQNHKSSQTLPELDALRTFVEQNDWHNDDPYQQSLRLCQWVKELPVSLFETVALSKTAVYNLLATAVDQDHYPIQDLLAFTALIHDVGKAETFQSLPEGTTRCPDHELAGARLVPVICARFDFTAVEIDFITALVLAHGEPYALFKEITTLPESQRQARVHSFEVKHAAYLRPLLLLAYGDMITSHLQLLHPEKYQAVSSFYRGWLKDVWSGRGQKGRKHRRKNAVNSS